MARSDGKRPDRVGERVREELMQLILRGAVHDPAVSDVVVSGVKVTEDLSQARVFVRTLNPLDEAGRARFQWDDSIDRAISIERLFDELRTEREPGAPGEAAPIAAKKKRARGEGHDA